MKLTSLEAREAALPAFPKVGAAVGSRDGTALAVALALLFGLDCVAPDALLVSALFAVPVCFLGGDSALAPAAATTLIAAASLLSPTTILSPSALWSPLLGVGAVWAAWLLSRVPRLLRRRTAAEQQRLRALLDGIPDLAVVMVDAAGAVTLWNEGARGLLGYEEAQVLGSPLQSLVSAADVSVASELAIALKSGRAQGEVAQSRKDGSCFQAGFTIVPILEGGRLAGYACVLRNLDERRSYESALQNAMQELARSNADLEQFAYVASHDLQEPLRAVSGCVQLLERRYRGKFDSSADELIQHTVEGVSRMQALINDLLAYSRVATRPVAREPLALSDVLQQSLSNLEVSLKESGAVVKAGELPVVRADAGQMRQLFQNLLSNSLKFRGVDSPEIRIHAERSGHDWVVRVGDNGIGIAPEYRERIFTIFQRLNPRTEYRGSGVGLAICKKVVERHGGRIWVEPVPQGGSEFCFSLPAM